MSSKLPACQLFKREIIPLAGFIESEKAPVNSSDYFALPSHCPTPGAGRRKIIKSQPVAEGPDDADRPSNIVVHTTGPLARAVTNL